MELSNQDTSTKELDLNWNNLLHKMCSEISTSEMLEKAIGEPEERNTREESER